MKTAGLGTMMFGLPYARAKSGNQQPPNIVILLADDLGWNDVSYHGGNISTPNIDRIAREGAELDRFYTCPVCTPTRAGLLTGRYPHRFGMQRGVMKPWLKGGLPPEEESLPEVVAKAGYERRACMGKWHLGHANIKYHPIKQGFTEFYGHYNGSIDYFTHLRLGQLDWHKDFEPCLDTGYSTVFLANQAVRFIESAKKPFLLYLPFSAVHEPLQAREEALRKQGFDPQKGRTPPEPWWGEKQWHGAQGRGNNKRQTYSAVVSEMDDAVGQILEALDRRGISDNTFVLFFSDNGGVIGHADNFPLRGCKTTLWEGGVRVVAAARWPKGIGNPGKIDSVMGYIDVLPTIRSILDIRCKPAKPLDGIDVFSALKGSAPVPKDRVIYLGRGAVVTREWKLVSKKLFRIDEDPFETKDLSYKYPRVKRRLKEIAARYRSLRAAKSVVTTQSAPSRPFVPPVDWQMPIKDKN